LNWRTGSRVYISDGNWFSGPSRKRKISGFPVFFRIFRPENDFKFKFRFFDVFRPDFGVFRPETGAFRPENDEKQSGNNDNVWKIQIMLRIVEYFENILSNSLYIIVHNA